MPAELCNGPIKVDILRSTYGGAEVGVTTAWQDWEISGCPQTQSWVNVGFPGVHKGVKLRKREFGTLTQQTGLAITVCDFSPGMSKWNRIGRRLFSHITMKWRGRPLVSHDVVVVDLIAATTTRLGLSVRSVGDPGSYPRGIKFTDGDLAAVPARPMSFTASGTTCATSPA